MTKYYSFSEEAVAAFESAALDKYDFTTCQRKDGSFYGTGGQCRKGVESEKPDKKLKTSSSSKGKAPLDTGAMSAMSDKQLSDLGKQKELDPTQKTAISNELRARAQASGDYDKFGNQARTEAAQKSIDEHYIKKEGGYIPRPEKMLKISEKDSYMDPDVLKSNIQFQREVTGAPNDKVALANLQHADRLQSAGAQKNNFDIFWEGGTVSLNKVVNGNHVQLYNNQGTIGWRVNKSYNTQDLPPESRRKIATETRKMWETMVRASSNNYPLSTSAYTGDGRGPERARAYDKMGFSSTKRPGSNQYAKVVFGNVIPITKAEHDKLYNSKYNRMSQGLEAMFAEPKGVSLSSKALDKLWQIIMGL